MTTARNQPIQREYRNVVNDNLRWNRITARHGDILVCTPAKCGTTWMQTIVNTLLYPHGDSPGSVIELAPWVDARFEPIDDIAARLEAQTDRRSMKTHTVADGIPWIPDSSYIVVGRDGRDAFMSFLNHMRNLRQDVMLDLVISAPENGIDLEEGGPPPVEDVHEFFTWWNDDNPMWFDHVASFWEHRDEPNVLFVHFNDMQDDLEGQMRRVAEFLDIDVDETHWPRLVERCTFASMKTRSAEIGDFDAHFVGGADTFLYKGSNGRWVDVLTDDELVRFDQRLHELLSPDAITWTMAGG